MEGLSRTGVFGKMLYVYEKRLFLEQGSKNLHPLEKEKHNRMLKEQKYQLFGPESLFDTEYDWAKVPPYNGNDPRPPLVV